MMRVGDKVRRTNGASYEKGCSGEIVAVDAEKSRAQIVWLTHPSGEAVKPGQKSKTWMGFKFLALI